MLSSYLLLPVLVAALLFVIYNLWKLFRTRAIDTGGDAGSLNLRGRPIAFGFTCVVYLSMGGAIAMVIYTILT